jgi:hypothetical protein
MAKTPEQILKEYADKVRRIPPENFDFLLTEIPERIRNRTRQGKGLLGKLKELSPKYIETRMRDKKKLYSETSASRSNLTRTGDMLNSIVGERIGYIFKFTFSNPDADKKAYWADQTGRPFFDLVPSQRKAIERDIAAIMRDYFRKMFKS